MKRWLMIIFALFLVTSYAPANAAEQGQSAKPAFKDLPDNHWAYAYVMDAVQKGTVKGFPNGTFKPNDPVTVAEFLKMMFLSMAEKDENGKLYWAKAQQALVPEWYNTIVYDGDVKFEQGSPWYINYVKSAKAMGVISQREYEGRYDENLTRERAAWMIEEFDGYFNGPISNSYAEVAGPQLFKDINKALDTFTKYQIAGVAIRGIMIGNNGYFNPKATITRAEAVKIVSLLPDASRRSKVSVNLKGVPYSAVTSPGYGESIFVFKNAEMKKVYDTLRNNMSSYKGSVLEDHARLGYYENDDKKEKGFHKTYFLDVSDTNRYVDMLVSFTSNNYSISLGLDPGYYERSSETLGSMLGLIYKDSDSVKLLISKAVVTARNGDAVDIRKTFNKRDILITSNGTKYLSISIGAYGDR